VALAAPQVATVKHKTPLRYLGWSVGVTYQAATRQGVSKDHLLRLLDEMAQHGMNLLNLMMLSYAWFDPGHDGYCWPVRNERLRHYWDAESLNGSDAGEYVSDVIAAAAERGIGVQLMMNWGIWDPDRMRLGYPAASLQRDRDGNPAGWLHCPDSPDVMQAGLDEMTDLLTYYDHPSVTSYAFERLSYHDDRFCFCEHTQRAYEASRHASLLDADAREITAWKSAHIGRFLREYVAHVKALRPGIDVWLHTEGSPGWGHDPASLTGTGISVLMPGVIHSPMTRDELYALLRHLAPHPTVAHFCVRDRHLKNYPIWIKTPEVIHTVLGWLAEYDGDNLAGIVFFNETAVSEANRRAVYEGIRRFT
jgi:hypothetical protein